MRDGFIFTKYLNYLYIMKIALASPPFPKNMKEGLLNEQGIITYECEKERSESDLVLILEIQKRARILVAGSTESRRNLRN